MRDCILILEDNAERIQGFKEAFQNWGGFVPEMKMWRTAGDFIRECDPYLDRACLISLDHDLNPQNPRDPDPGTGLDVATHLARFPMICPVILHTSNAERVWSMHNEFRFAGWTTARVMPLGDDWIGTSWLTTAKQLLEAGREQPPFRTRPSDHDIRLERARRSLSGLAVGDAFGEMFFCPESVIKDRLQNRALPPGPWFFTDDTVMGMSVIETLAQMGKVHPDYLARAFVRRYVRDPNRGYGATAQSILRQIADGKHWRAAAAQAFDGMGSYGNGGGMRTGPLGAYFADNIETLVQEALVSASVTHSHADGQAGAVAVAAAAAWAVRSAPQTSPVDGRELLHFALAHTPHGAVHRGLQMALNIPLECHPLTAAGVLGCGKQVAAADTIPFALWCAAGHLRNFADAMWHTVTVLGDRDTTCAIVGSIVALSAGGNAIPAEWISATEPFPEDFVLKSL